MGLSRLSEACRKCPFVKTCQSKRMEALGYLPEPSLSTSYGESVAANVTNPILRETMTIVVNGERVVVYKDEIEKEIYKSLYQHLQLPLA